MEKLKKEYDELKKKIRFETDRLNAYSKKSKAYAKDLKELSDTKHLLLKEIQTLEKKIEIKKVSFQKAGEKESKELEKKGNVLSELKESLDKREQELVVKENAFIVKETNASVILTTKEVDLDNFQTLVRKELEETRLLKEKAEKELLGLIRQKKDLFSQQDTFKKKGNILNLEKADLDTEKEKIEQDQTSLDKLSVEVELEKLSQAEKQKTLKGREKDSLAKEAEISLRERALIDKEDKSNLREKELDDLDTSLKSQKHSLSVEKQRLEYDRLRLNKIVREKNIQKEIARLKK